MGLAPPSEQVMSGARRFGLIDTVRLERLAFYSGDDDFDLHPRRLGLTRGTRLLRR